jgi:effector-binding domain-containing protein
VSGEVRVEHVEPRSLAAVRSTTLRSDLASAIYRSLDAVWPVLREQGVRTGHNVVVYDGGDETSLEVLIGVEVFGDFDERGDVRRASTPAGEAVTTAHFGDYSEMASGYAALERWCAEHARQQTGVSWEVYGDWSDDPAQVRTDLYWLLEPDPAT